MANYVLLFEDGSTELLKDIDNVEIKLDKGYGIFDGDEYGMGNNKLKWVNTPASDRRGW